jgi:hypothetical protein
MKRLSGPKKAETKKAALPVLRSASSAPAS